MLLTWLNWSSYPDFFHPRTVKDKVSKRRNGSCFQFSTPVFKVLGINTTFSSRERRGFSMRNMNASREDA
ncbi:unnamed protein product [Arabidopsis arenosa]|uniref:Uncharacterized protein n=1 Tax=Arabidopsis arenosa TaxID=38785 RepID=A0A8S2AAP7_ARAAE|nr:unnamed protein product [Arabidopsis arenosa]